jgi:hypothetical protein
VVRIHHPSPINIDEGLAQLAERLKYQIRHQAISLETQVGAVGGYLHAHHIKEWEYYPELRYELSNGMTLCRRPCHKEIHDARRTNRKVSDEQVQEIKAMRASGATLHVIGKKYGVSAPTISDICSGKKRTVAYNTTEPQPSIPASGRRDTHGKHSTHPPKDSF